MRGEMHTWLLWGNLKAKINHSEDLCADWRIILKRVFLEIESHGVNCLHLTQTGTSQNGHETRVSILANKGVRSRNCLLNNKLFALIDTNTANCKKHDVSGRSHLNIFTELKVKIKVKFTLEQGTRAQRGSRGIALLFL
jgi:hypothetical protein